MPTWHVYPVNSPDEFFAAYAKTGCLVMMLQAAVEFESYYRCYCIGRKSVRIMPYEPRNDYARRYQANHPPMTKELEARIVKDTITLNTALGYDLNTCEYAVKDGVPYAIDFMNWAPDCNPDTVGVEYVAWVVSELTKHIVERLKNPRTDPRFASQLLMRA